MLELDGQPGSYRLHVSSPAGDDSVDVGFDPACLGVDLGALQERLLDSATRSPAVVPELGGPLRRVGEALFEAVFQASVRALFLSSRNEVERAGPAADRAASAPAGAGHVAMGAVVQRPLWRLPVSA